MKAATFMTLFLLVYRDDLLGGSSALGKN